MSVIVVTWDITNGIETKIVKHPSGDTWNEGNVCSEFIDKNNQHPTSMDVIVNEINWFRKYSGEKISVYDKWAGGNLSVESYIRYLQHCVKEIESYS
tara:strand:+ start:270 stop:560 length:291 start_codon:yes stop_codon:yes gene_type:complete